MTAGRPSAAELYHARTKNVVSDREAILRLTGRKSVVEVGCGTGRILRWLVGQGSSKLLGVDIDCEKIRVAGKDPSISSAPELELICADFLQVVADFEYDVVLFAFNALAEFISVEDRISALKHARTFLAREGHLVVLSSMHDFTSFARSDVSYAFDISYDGMECGVSIDCTRDIAMQVSRCTVKYHLRQDNCIVIDRYENALLTRNELLATYSAAGLEVVSEYGSYDLKALCRDSDVLIHVLRRAVP